MTKRFFALLLAMLTMFSAISPAYAAEATDTQTISCTNSQECQADEHSESCCVPLGCADTHLQGCLHYITVDNCSLCAGTVENHALDCVTFCARQDGCGATAHHDDCPMDSDAATHADGCKFPEATHDTCKTVCDEGCVLESNHTGDCQQPAGCTAEGCEFAADHGGLHSNQEPCATAGCEQAAGHPGNCTNSQPQEPSLSEQAQAVVALLEALPSADSIPADLSDEEWEQQMSALETAMNAYNALGAEDMNLVNEQYAALVLNALAINDALTGFESTAYAEIAYNPNSRNNVTITLVDQFDYPATGASITVTRGNDTHEVRELGNGRYAFTKNGGSGNYTIEVNAAEKYASATTTIRSNSSSAAITVEVLGEYWLNFRLYYYIEQDFFPSTYGGYGDPEHYGPSGDDTPFMILPVDVNKLREIAETNPAVVFRPSPSNSNQWEFTPAGTTSPKDTALTNTKAFWTQVLSCISAESMAALNATGVGKVFNGYALKKQEGSSLHIDGVLDAVLPVYIIEMYDSGVYFAEFYADSVAENPDFKSMQDVLDAFKAKLGLGTDVTIDWQAQANDTYIGTYIANNRQYTVTVTRINSNKDHGEDIKNGVRYYSQSSDDSYYLAKFNMSVEAGDPLYTVTYQWKVYGTDGQVTDLPAGTFDVPVPVTGLEANTDFEYNKGFTSETGYPDYENGVLYTFSGWTNYANISEFAPEPDSTHMEITSETVPITGDTWINGYWRATPLAPANAHIMLKKKVVVAEGGDEAYVKKILSETGRMFIRIDTHADKDNDGKTYIDADFGQITAADGHRVDVYVYDEDFEFTEMQAEVPGYTLTKEVEVSGSYIDLTKSFGEDGVVKVDMTTPQGENVELGTVTFTNTYTKIEGDAVSEYPTLELYKFAGDTSEPMSGVTFTLTSKTDDTNGKTATTDADGVLNFGEITVGEYFLKEVNVPEGYKLCAHHGENGYTVKVAAAGEPVEELRDGKFVMVQYHTIVINEDGTCDHLNLIEPLAAEDEEENTYELRLSNEPILGTVEFTKDFTGADAADYADVFMQLHLHGPITRDAQNNIESIGTSHIVELNAAKGWKETVTDLPLGEYLLHEPLYDIHGYTWLGATYNDQEPATEYNGSYYYLVTIAQGESAAADAEITLNVTNTYEEWSAAMLTVYKVTAGNPRTPLAGAQFTLYSDEACKDVVATHTTGDDGVIRFDNLTVPKDDEDGIAEFYLKETKAPAGYYLSQEVWQIEVKLDENNVYQTKVTRNVNGDWVETPAFSRADDTLTVTNTPVGGRLNIKKTFSGEKPEGIQEIQVQVVKGGTVHGTYVLNDANSWTATATNLPVGSYTVRETVYAVPGYDLVQDNSTTSVDVTLSDTTGLIVSADNGPVADVELKNEYQRNERFIEHYASFSVLKVDSATKQPLKDAVFTLYEGEGTSGSVIATLYTSESGKATFSNLHGTIASDGKPKDGTYTLVETEAPGGYVKTDTQWKVTVKEDDGQYRVVLNKQGNIFENIWDWIVGGITNSTGDLDENNVLTVENERAKYSMTISKKFTENNADLETLPENAFVELLVTGPNHYSQSIKLDGKTDDIETSAWTATLTDLELGQYTVKETMASLHGHTWLSATIDVNGAEKVNAATESAVQYTFAVTDQDSIGDVKVSNGDTVAVEVKNTYEVWESVDFYVQKVDAVDKTILLDNVTFQLYDENGNKLEQEDCEFTTSATTDSSGLAHFTGFTVPDGSTSVTYVLKEEVAHDGYIKCTDEWNVTITKSENQYKLAITNRINGANGTFDKAIDRLIVENTYDPVSLQIKKDFSGVDEDHISGSEIKIQVTGPYGYSETFTLDGIVDETELKVETDPWTATLSGLRMGEYTIEEIGEEVPGYTLQSTVYTAGEEDGDAASIAVTLDSTNQTKAVTIINTYRMNSNEVVNPASFQILKVDATDESKKLEGAVFGLFGADETTAVFTATTDENGIAEFTDLVGDAQNPENEVIYTLKEITAPAGYLKTDQSWKVVVKEVDGQVEVKLHAEGNHYDSIWDWIVDVFNGQTAEETSALSEGALKVANTPTKLTLNKVENWYLDGQLTDIAAIEEFKEDEIPERTYTFQIEWQVGGTTFNINKEISLDELTNGSVVVEGVIPEGASYKVTELTHGTTDFIVTYGVGCEGIMGEDSSATVTNSYYYNHVDPENDDKELTDQDTGKLSVRLNLLKMDAEANEVLKDAKFELLDGNDQKVGEATSDENGQLSFVISSAGDYKLVETQAPDGYSKLASPIPVKVAESESYTTNEVINNATVTVTHVELRIESAGNLTQENGRYVVDNEPLVDLTVNKVWDDGNYHKRPTYVQVKLLKDGVEAEGYTRLTLSEKNSWTATWTDLDANTNWSVEEASLGDNYVASYSATTSGNKINVTVTNTRAAQPIDITVKKVWRGGTGSSVTVKLYGDGKLVDTVKITAESGWKHTWKNLPDNVEYKVDEAKMAGYYKKVTHDVSGQNWVITNTVSVIPGTGDTILLAVGVMAISAAALVILLAASRKRKKYN